MGVQTRRREYLHCKHPLPIKYPRACKKMVKRGLLASMMVLVKETEAQVVVALRLFLLRLLLFHLGGGGRGSGCGGGGGGRDEFARVLRFK